MPCSSDVARGDSLRTSLLVVALEGGGGEEREEEEREGGEGAS